MVFPVVMYGWELNHKEGWGLKNWCFRIVVLDKNLESLLDCKEIKPVHSKENQPWVFIGKTVAEAPKLWPSNAKSRFIGKDPDSGKDRRQKERRWQRIGWIAPPIQWTWTWANSRRWWGTGRPGMLQSVESQRVKHNLAIEHHHHHRLQNESLFSFLM